MSENSFYFEKLKRNWKFVFYFALFTGIIVFDVSLTLPVKYESEVSVIVIQKQTSDEVDAFSATKSAEYLSGILSKAIYTDGFLNDVLESPFNVKKIFPSDGEERKKEWERTTKTKRINNTGIVNVKVLSETKLEAEKIAQAIAWNLSENGQDYHGGGDRVEIRLIDGPITPKDPAWPKLWINALLGFFLGIIGSAVYVYIYPYSRFLK